MGTRASDKNYRDFAARCVAHFLKLVSASGVSYAIAGMWVPKSHAIAANGRVGAYARIPRSRHTIDSFFHYPGTGMLTLAGASALSPFRLRRLLGELQSIASDVRAVQARFMHFVEIDAIDGDVRDDERAMLQQLLDYGPHREAQQYAGELFLVVPRPGTLSPWSSKATDIAHNCGLARVRRIERGIAYYVSCDGAIAEQLRARIAASLHDRMVESVFASLDDAANLFLHETPRALRTVDILGGGRAALERANRESGFALADRSEERRVGKECLP